MLEAPVVDHRISTVRGHAYVLAYAHAMISAVAPVFRCGDLRCDSVYS